MRHKSRAFQRVLAFLPLLAAAAPGIGAASTVALNGTGTMSFSYQYLYSSPSTPTVGNDYSLTVPGQYTFLDPFLTQQPATPNLGVSGVGPYDFQDSYRFTIGQEANGNTMTASLGLGDTFNIANLQFRLYRVSDTGTVPVVGGIPGGSAMIQPWIGPPSGSNQITATFAGIQSGTYILDIAGIANGASGGTYIGQLNLTPVPLPAAAWFFGSGLLGLLGFKRRAVRAAG